MKVLICTMPDGSSWAVPVGIIALNRARVNAGEYGGDVAKSLALDTLPLFDKYIESISEWAENNMDWSDVKHNAKRIGDGEVEYQEGWVNGIKGIVDMDKVEWDGIG